MKTRVLVVDDHHDTAHVIRKFFERLGYDVRLAGGYDAALAAARAGPVDNLVTDIQLADGDGCDLLRAVTALHPVKGIAMSGHVAAEDRGRYDAAGFRCFLAKPFDFGHAQAVLAALAAE